MRNIFQALFGKRDAVNTALPTLAVDLPFEMIAVPGAEALVVRDELRAKGGNTPVILGSEEDVQLLVEIASGAGQSPEQVIDEASRIDVAAWLALRRQDDPELYGTQLGDWPEEAPQAPGLSVHLDTLTRRPKKSVILALVPTPASWQVPAHLDFGGWNECPPPAVHVALHHKWHQDFAADIACLSSDVLECTVGRPPATREAALALAREQFLYCPDIVHQGVGSVEALAASLLTANTWYFWWD
jgi:hypothetical protein